MHLDGKSFKKILDWTLDNPALIFLLLALVFGIIFIFRLAPLNGTDEFTHFPRAYQISDGTFWEKKLPQQQYGGTLPSNINNMINDYRDLSRKPSGLPYNYRENQLNNQYGLVNNVGKNSSTAVFTSVVTYPPWAYAPNVVGIWLAKLFNLPLIWYVYLGRLVGLFVWIGLTYWAIKILPFGKWFLFTLALLPTSLTQSATIGADGLLNGLFWLLIALFISIITDKHKLTKFKLILIPLLSIFASTIKVGYWLIPMIFLATPANYFPTKTFSKIWKSSLVAGTAIASVWFTLHNVSVANGVNLTPRLGNYINSKDQISYVLHNSFVVIARLLVQPFTKNYDTVYLGIVGIITNRLIYLSIFVIMLLFLSLWLSFNSISSQTTRLFYKKRFIFFIFAIIVGTYCFLALAFYVGNTQVASTVVFGMYGRYFLPFLPLLIILPLTIKRKNVAKNLFQPLAIISILVIGLIASVISLG